MPEAYEFEEVVSSVEERFRRAYDTDTMGSAKVESHVEYESISTGWWLVIRHMGIALRIGKEKPDFVAGDTVTINIRKNAKGQEL
jgi:hypothetical protein